MGPIRTYMARARHWPGYVAGTPRRWWGRWGPPAWRTWVTTKYWRWRGRSDAGTRHALLLQTWEWSRRVRFILRHHRANRVAHRVMAGLPEGMKARVYTSPPEGLSLCGVLAHVDLMADQSIMDVLPILEAFDEAGWEAFKSSDYAELGRRTFTLKPGRGDARIEFSVFTWNSQRCHKVVVGTEPKYELRCSNG